MTVAAAAGTGGLVGADTAALHGLSATLDAHGASLATTAADAASLLAVLRGGVAVRPVVPRPAVAELRLGDLAVRLGGLAVEVDEVAQGLHLADTAPCVGLPSWWVPAVRPVRAVDDLAPHDVPGLGWIAALPGTASRSAGVEAWRVTRAVDLARDGRLDRALVATRWRTARRAGALAGRLVGTAVPTVVAARVADVMATPMVRRLAQHGSVAGPVLWRAAGRAVVGVQMLADGIDAVEEFVAGDHAAAWRSVAEVAGGALILGTGPVGAAVGVAIIAGVAVYENREAIGREMRAGWRATTRAASRAASAVGDAAEAVDSAVDDAVDTTADAMQDAAQGALDGARRLLGGLF